MNVACIFPGHGGLSVGVGKCLFDRCDTVRRTFEEADDVLHYPLTRLMLRGPQATLLRSEHAQAALLTLSTALHRAFMRRFVQQRDGVVLAYAGYSLGEFTALVASGAIGFAEALQLVHRRGLWMSWFAPEGGAMAVVLGLDAAHVDRILRHEKNRQVYISGYNGPRHVTISGLRVQVERAVEHLRDAGARHARTISVALPFHTPLMRSAQAVLANDVRNHVFAPPKWPMYSSVSGQLIEEASRIGGLLTQQITGPVRWQRTVAAMREGGVDTFVEMGPGRGLTHMLRYVDPGLSCYSIEDHASQQVTLESLALRPHSRRRAEIPVVGLAHGA